MDCPAHRVGCSALRSGAILPCAHMLPGNAHAAVPHRPLNESGAGMVARRRLRGGRVPMVGGRVPMVGR
eukprot:5139801-Prymnesium_polylepis.1